MAGCTPLHTASSGQVIVSWASAPLGNGTQRQGPCSGASRPHKSRSYSSVTGATPVPSGTGNALPSHHGMSEVGRKLNKHQPHLQEEPLSITEGWRWQRVKRAARRQVPKVLALDGPRNPVLVEVSACVILRCNFPRCEVPTINPPSVSSLGATIRAKEATYFLQDLWTSAVPT